MQHVLVLTADPSRRLLTDADASNARDALAGHATETGAIDRIAPGIAAEIPFDAPDPAAAANVVRAALANRPVDANAVPAQGRRKRLLIADMDSTIIRGESLDDLAELAGIGDRVAPVTARAMRGEIGFEDALRERVDLLAGRPATLIDRLLAEKIEPTPGAAALVATMKAAGARCALVSGGFDVVTSLIRNRLGFDVDRSNHLVVEDGTITGRVADPILGRDAKVAALREFCEHWRIAVADAIAVGDGANDIAMLTTAGLGVAFHGKPVVRQAAAVAIDHGDLTALLYIQGYRAGEIVAADA